MSLDSYSYSSSSSSSSSVSSSSVSSSLSMSNNVQVAVRCRPISLDEKKNNVPSVVSCQPDGRSVQIQHGIAGKKVTKSYNFDKVFGMYSTQEEVFQSIVRPIVDEVLAGFNCTIFAYGQTGTGKTHTMEGDLNNEENAGIVPRAVKSIFEQLESSGVEFTIRVSFLELYNEELQDLLATKGNEKKLKLCEDERRGVICQNLEEITVLSSSDIFTILRSGIQNRQTAATLCNKNSSRSHSIFTMKIMVRESSVDGEEVVRHGQLNLVDLAGSECVKRSGANEKGNEKQAREAGSINQSLLTLGRVITALVDHHGHIPYRDSKLTRLLQESLGGKAKTCIIATLSPASSNIEETMSTLDYAHRARSIKNQPTVNAKMTKKVVLKEYCEEIEYLRSQLQLTREKNGVFMDPNDFYLRESKITTLESQLTECEGTLKMKSEELKQAKGIKDSLLCRIHDMEKRVLEEEKKVALLSNSLLDSERSLSLYKDYLRATQTVVAEQSTTETSLFTSATSLQDEVSLRRSQIGLLFNKLDRSRQCDAMKAAELTSFIASTRLNHIKISQSIDELAASVAVDNKSSLDATDLLIEKAKVTCDLLTSTMTDVVLQTDSHLSSGQHDMVTSCSQLKSDLAASRDDLVMTIKGLQEDLFQWIQQCKCQIEHVGESLEGQGSKIVDFQSEMNDYISTQEASMDSYYSSQVTRSSETHKGLMDLQDCISEILSKQSKTVSLQQDNNKDINLRIKMIEDYVTNQLSGLLTSINSSHKDCVESMDSSVSEVIDTVKTSTQKLIASEDNYLSSTRLFIDDNSKALRSQAQAVSVALTDAIRPFSDAIRQDVASMSSSLDVTTNTISDTCKGVLQRSDESLQDTSMKVEVLETAGKQTLQSVSSAIGQMKSSMVTSIDGDFVKFLDSHGTSCKDQLSEHFSSLQSSLAALSSSELPSLLTSLDSFGESYNREEVQVSSFGDTPKKAKSDLEKPFDQLNKTRSHKVIMSEALAINDANINSSSGQSMEETKNYDFSILLPQNQEFVGDGETTDGGVVAFDCNRSILVDFSSTTSSALSSASSSPRKRKSMIVNSSQSFSNVPSSTSKLLQPSNADMENTHPNQSPSISSRSSISSISSSSSSSGPSLKVPRIGLISSTIAKSIPQSTNKPMAGGK